MKSPTMCKEIFTLSLFLFLLLPHATTLTLADFAACAYTCVWHIHVKNRCTAEIEREGGGVHRHEIDFDTCEIVQRQ